MSMDVVNGIPRDEWLAQRRAGIGASDAAAIVNLHPYKSALSLYWDKTGEYADTQMTEPMEWGIRLEPVVAEAWSEKTGLAVANVEKILVHPEHEWMICNLDRAVIDGNGEWVSVLEVKTCNAWAADDWENDGIPYYVVVQVQHQLAVTGLATAHVACLIGGSRFVRTTIDRDEELIAGLIEAERKFWQRIQDRRPPPADGHPNTTEVLKDRWKDETLAEAVDLGPEGHRLVNLRHQVKAVVKAAEVEVESVDNQIRLLLGENEVGTVDGRVAVTWKPNAKGNRVLLVKEI